MADGPFREHIKNLVERIDGGLAAVLMGFDGISLDSYAKPHDRHSDRTLPDIQTLAMEFAHLISQTRRTLQSLDAGALEEFTLRAEALTLVVRVVTTEYFLACAILPGGNLGKTRYLMRISAPALSADL
jgi:predicted regulator of Ras-like GTPase activity (Roadblock/LC7/MglB family)